MGFPVGPPGWDVLQEMLNIKIRKVMYLFYPMGWSDYQSILSSWLFDYLRITFNI